MSLSSSPEPSLSSRIIHRATASNAPAVPAGNGAAAAAAKRNSKRRPTTIGDGGDSSSGEGSEGLGKIQANPNADWVNFRGTWFTMVVMAVALKVLFSSVPSMSTEMSWTLTNLTYNLVRSASRRVVRAQLLLTGRCGGQFSFFFFHWLCGTPFDLNQGEYRALTLWEQLDEGRQFTPIRKFLTIFPIALYVPASCLRLPN